MYTAAVTHNEETFRRLARVQYNAFCTHIKLGVLLLSAACICLGVFGGIGNGSAMALLLIGCWAAVSIQYPAHRNANKLIALANGSFPRTSYEFQEKYIQIKSGGEIRSLKYDQIFSLLEDQEYFYLFQNRFSGYMVLKASLHPAGIDLFRKFLEEKTGLRRETAGGLMSFNIQRLLLRRQNARTRKAREH